MSNSNMVETLESLRNWLSEPIDHQTFAESVQWALHLIDETLRQERETGDIPRRPGPAKGGRAR